MEWCISDRLKEGCGMELRMWDGTHRFRGAPDGTGQEDSEKKRTRPEVSQFELSAVGVVHQVDVLPEDLHLWKVYDVCLEAFNWGLAADTVRRSKKYRRETSIV